jgi:hypothetical protein
MMIAMRGDLEKGGHATRRRQDAPVGGERASPFSSATPCYNARMTDKPAPNPARPPLHFTPNFVDGTAEKIGTVIGIVGATGAGKGAPKQPMPN